MGKSSVMAWAVMFCLCATGAAAQAPPTPGLQPGASSRAFLLPACPSAGRPGPRLGGIFADILGGVLKYAFVKVADLFADSIKNENAKLNGVATYQGFEPFYGQVAGGKPSQPAKCLVLVRFDGRTPANAVLLGRIQASAADLVARAPEFVSASGLATPAFYGEFDLAPLAAATPAGPGQAGFQMAPRLVFYGNTAARRWGPKGRKAVRVEIELRRLLDTGALAEKPYYATAFNLGDAIAPGTALDDFGDALGPPALYPSPKDLKAQPVFSSQGQPMAGPVIDQAPTAITAKVVEAEDPGFLMRALEQVFADNKAAWEKQAAAAAEHIVVEIRKAAED